MAEVDPRLGRIIRDRFDVKEVLGAGGMGVVYRAHDRVRRMDVALKTLQRLSADWLHRFKHEFRALSGVVAPNLATLYELQADGDDWFFTMELIEGRSFLEHVRPHQPLVRRSDDHASMAATTAVGNDSVELLDSRTAATVAGSGRGHAVMPPRSFHPRRAAIIEAPLDWDRLRTALPQLARGLIALHDSGQLHRDIKPSNVLIDTSERVVICDFGLVADLVSDDNRTPDLEVVGTPAYMSPEQAAGESLSIASDWYSVGVMLYEALTGRLPFEGAALELLEARKAVEPPPPKSWNNAIPDRWNDLCAALLRRDPAARPNAEAVLTTVEGKTENTSASRSSAHRNAIFVGRQQQLATLDRAFVESRAGCRALLVSGPSGIGKSALVRHFISTTATHSDALVFSGRCFERESVPFKAIDSLIDDLTSYLMKLDRAARRELLPQDIRALARLFPVLGQVTRPETSDPAVSDDMRADQHGLRERAFAALGEVLRQLAERRPIVLFIDDLQWGDVDSAPFFFGLLHVSPAPQLLLLATCRNEHLENSALLQTLLAPPSSGGVGDQIEEVELGPLTDAESRKLAEMILATGDRCARTDVDAIARDAQGNPFFVTEIAHARGQLVERDANTLTLDDLLARRIATLSDDARRLLTAAAVAGRPVPVDLLSRSSGVQNEATALATLVAVHLVRSHIADGHEHIEPYHDRVRETATADMSERDTRRTHRRLARALEDAPVCDPQALVEHWLGAGDKERAGHYALLAAQQAHNAMAFERAAYHYQLRLDLLEMDREEERELQIVLGHCLTGAGQLSLAGKAYLDAAAGAPPEQALELRRLAAEQKLRALRFDEGIEICADLLKAVGISMPRSTAGAVLTILWGRLRNKLAPFRLRPAPPNGLTARRRWQLEVLWTTVSSVNMSNPIFGAALHTRYYKLAMGSGDRAHAALALGTEMGYGSFVGERVKAELDDVAALAFRCAAESGDPAAEATLRALRTTSLLLVGELRACVEMADSALAMLAAHRPAARYETAQAIFFGYGAMYMAGELRRLAEDVPRILHDGLQRGDEFLLTGLRSSRTNTAWLVLDRPAEAREHVHEAIRAYPEQTRFGVYQFYQRIALANIHLYEGDGSGAWASVEEAWQRWHKSSCFRIYSIRVESHYARARAAAVAAREAPSADVRESLLDQARRSAAKIEAERTRSTDGIGALVRATVADVAGDREGAIALLAQAEKILLEREYVLWGRTARYRRGQLLGGDEGDGLVREVTNWMQSEAVVAPGRLARTFAP